MDSSLKSLFVLVSDVSACSHILRGHVFELFLPKPRSDMLKNCFIYRVIKAWNSLPQTVCEAGTLSKFKIKLTDYLHNDYISVYLCIYVCLKLMSLNMAFSLRTFVHSLYCSLC